MSTADADTAAVARVAYAIARVIATREVYSNLKLRRLDALGRASAVHTMAQNMAPKLTEEAAAAYAMALQFPRPDVLPEAANG